MPELLDLEVHRRGDAVLVSATGEFDISSAPAVRRCIADLVRQPDIRRLFIDLRGLSFMDSIGIRLLLEVADGSRHDGYEFAVVKGRPVVHRVIEMTGVDERLPLVASPEELGFRA